MPAILDILRQRQDGLQTLYSKGQFAEPAKFSRNFAIINKDMAAPMAVYCDSMAKCDSLSEREGISKWILSTECMDREGDVLMPSGCLDEIEAFRQNPVVDYDHRRFHVLPVGKSVGITDPTLPVSVVGNKVMAGCKHHHETQFADEVARLVFKGLLNACSVAFVPVVGERLNKSFGGDKTKVTPRFKFSRWQMTAWSICPIGVNPEALRIELSAGRISDEFLVKSLSPFAQKAAIWSPGFSFEVDSMVDLKSIEKSHIGAVRFHKSQFVKQEDCVSWLKANDFDPTLVVDNKNSYDFEQLAGELDEKTAKVADGVYVVYAKAFPPPKKKKPGEEKPASNVAKDAPPVGKKPGSDVAKPSKTDHPEDNGLDDFGDDTAAGDDTNGKAPNPDDNADTEGQGLDDDPDPASDTGDIGDTAGADAAVDKVGDVFAGGGGTPTFAGQAMIDLLKHRAAEIRFITQSMASHDHPGAKDIFTKMLPAVQKQYDALKAASQQMFPDINFDKATDLDAGMGDDLGGDMGGDDMGADKGMDDGSMGADNGDIGGADKADDDMGGDDTGEEDKAPEGLNGAAGNDGAGLADPAKKKKKPLFGEKSLSEDDLLLIAMELMI